MIFKKIVWSLLFLTSMMPAETAVEKESFLAKPVEQKTNKKKKKSLATMRQEFTESCEAYAHALIQEVYVVGSCMSKSPAGNKATINLLRERCQELQEAEQFFVSGRCGTSEGKVTGEVAWRLVQQYARVQEALLFAITDLLEQNEKSCFMTADKQQLQSYQESVQSLQEESELLVKELQAISNQATLTK